MDQEGDGACEAPADAGGGERREASEEEEVIMEAQIELPASLPRAQSIGRDQAGAGACAPPAASSGERHGASQEEVTMNPKIQEALTQLEALGARVSELLGAAVLRGSMERRCLMFMDTELTFLLASARTLGPEHFDGETTEMLRWFKRLYDTAQQIQGFLEEVDPRRHTLLLAALPRFRRRNPASRRLFSRTSVLFLLARECSWLQAAGSSDLGLLPPQPQEAEPAAGVPLVGIDRPAKKLLRWLTPPDKSLRVLAIVGPLGIGKTTLAMELRKRLVSCKTSQDHHNYDFQCHVAVKKASRRADNANEILLRDILSKIPGPSTAPTLLPSDQPRRKTMELLVRHVSERLDDKRYLIIIDDIREASDWEQIRGAFPNNNLGSRILVTLSYRSTAWLSCFDSDDVLVHEMKPLNQKDSERLLLAKAFGCMDDGCLPENHKLLVDEFLRRCGGIPLFLTGMADWFKEQLQQQQQQQNRREEALLEQIPQLPKLLEQALSMAYDDLPYVESKLTLLYVATFHNGYKFDNGRLYLKLIFEGIPVDILIDELKEEYLRNMLLEWNVITRVAGNCERSTGCTDDAEAYQWHVNPVVQQFLASKSARIGFGFTSATLRVAAAPATTGHGNEAGRTPRRLALHQPDPNIPMDLSQTRSLAVSGAVSGIPLDKFFNLVILDLEGWENLKDEDLLQVCKSKMLFLKYLSVRNTTVSKIPPEIKELCSLRVLDVSRTKIMELPLEVFQLEDLYQLDLRGTRIRQLPEQIAGLRHPLRVFLVDGEGMTYPTETGTRMPKGISRLHLLNTLSTVDLSEQPASFVEELGRLDYLKVPAITWSLHQCSDGPYREALLSSIQKWERLRSLTIHCGLGCSMVFLGSLSRPPQWLEKFKVKEGRFASVPRWINGLKYLSFVQITICRVGTDGLNLLRDLQYLKCLILGLDFIPEEAIVIENEGFPKLERFSVDCPVPWLSFQAGAMPKLRYLQLKFCATPASQASVPSGISNLRNLNEVALCYHAHYMNSPSVKMTVKAVKNEVAKHPYQMVDLFVNGIEQDVEDVDEEVENVTEAPSGTDAATGARGDAQAAYEEAAPPVEIEITEE